MHEAFSCETVLDNQKHAIVTLHAYSNKLLLVDSQNTLTHYQVYEHNAVTNENGDGDGGATPAKALQTIKAFSRSRPVKLHAIKETSMLLALADSFLSIYSLTDISLLQKLASTKTATTFSVWSGVDHSSGIPILTTLVAVCVKRQILLFTWLDSEFEGERHFDCPDRGKVVEFLTNETLLVGMTNDFVMIDLKDGRVEALQVPIGGSLGTVSTTMGYLGTRAPKSILTRTKDQMLLVKDVQSCFIDMNGDDAKGKPINWATAPEFVGYTYPYLVVVLKNRVEIRNSKSGALLQILDVPNVQLMNDGKSLFIATTHKVMRLNTIPYSTQVEELIDSRQLSECLSLLDTLDGVLLDDKAGLIRRTKELLARKAFETATNRDEYDASMDLFSESWTVPSTVVQLLPKSDGTRLRSSSSDHTEHSAEQSTLQAEGSTTESIKEQPRSSVDEPSRTSHKVTETLSPLEDSASALSKAAHQALQGFLARSRRLLIRFIANPPVQDSEDQYFTPWPNSAPLTREDMESELGVTDTALLRVYIMNSPGLVGSLVRLPNRCDPDVVKEYLVREDRWKELVDFYYGKGLHRQALALLQEKEAILMGIHYLQRLDHRHWDVITEFAPWVLKNTTKSIDNSSVNQPDVDDIDVTDLTQNSAMDIFIDSSPESESFDRLQVAEFLKSLGPTFCIQYLEYIVKECGETTPRFSEDLICLYIAQVRVADLVAFLQAPENTASPTRIYSRIPQTADFYETRAVVLAMMGNLRKALDIHVHKIKDPAKSEAFAAKQFTNDPNAFEILLELYLTTQEGQEPQVPDALSLLKRHGPRLDAEKVMSSLPFSTSLSSIHEYLTTRLQSTLLLQTSSLIESKLRESYLLSTQLNVISLRNKSYKVGTDRVCAVCHKRLGNSVLAVFPDGACVHYGCQKRYTTTLSLEQKANEI